MPDDMFAYAEAAAGRGLKAIIAGAGGAAHLPGMLAAKTPVPVLGVPVPARHLSGVDSLHSIVQMPKGVPVATFAIGAAGAANAALFAVAMLANEDPALRKSSRPSAPPDRSRTRHGGAPPGGRMSRKPILPGQVMPSGQLATLGVMGGGQLGRMFVQAAQEMGYFTAVLDPDPASPAGLVSHYHIETPYLDEQGLAQLMQRCEAITTEFENVPAPALITLGAHRPVAPAPTRWPWRRTALPRKPTSSCAQAGGVPCAPYAVIETEAAAGAVPDELLPGILKTARLGYDGKGQVRVPTAPNWPPPGTSWAACPACWSSCCRSRPSCRSSWRGAPTARWCTSRCSATCTATASWP
jgi:hypothetical protein